MADDDPVLMRLHASPGRRFLGILLMAVLAVLLIGLALTGRVPIGGALVLLAAGGVSAWMGVKMWRDSAKGIELTQTVLRDTSGEVIAQVSQIEGLDRGMLAFKPSNGFLLHTSTPQGPRAWRPGLWWRAGRRIGVGGVTSAAPARAMCDALQSLMVQNGQD